MTIRHATEEDMQGQPHPLEYPGKINGAIMADFS